MQRNRVFFGMLSVCLQLVFLHLTGFDNWLISDTSVQSRREAERMSPIGLDDYALDTAVRVSCLAENLSGITFCPWSNALFAVVNDPPKVVIMNPAGICLREILLVGFEDTEGIVCLEAERFAIVEERHHTINIVPIDDQTRVLHRSDVIHSLQVDFKAQDNKGLEGIAYDAATDRIYLVNEKKPRQFLSVGGLSKRLNQLDIRLESDLLPRRWFMKDLSGLHFDAASRHLLLVSDESQCVFEVALDGQIVGQLELTRGLSGLKADIPQAEGITMDDAGHIYIVSEPDRLYRFSLRLPPLV
jgi:uncharacterized protein YjiK